MAAIDSPQFAGRAHRRARHARQVLVAQEEVLYRDSSRLAGRHRNLDTLLGLDGLVNAVAPFSPFGQPAGELIDDHDFAVAHHVLAFEEILAIDDDRLLDVLVDVDHAHRVERRRLLHHADFLPPLFGQLSLLLLVLVLVIVVLDELLDDRRAPLVTFDGELLFLGGQGADDQRRAGLVDQNAVGLVDQGEMGVALNRLFVGRDVTLSQHPTEHVRLPLGDAPEQQAVAEKIEAELLRRSIGDVAGVGLAPLRLRHLRFDHADAQAEQLVDRRIHSASRRAR